MEDLLDLGSTLHLVAGLGALGMGYGILVRRPERASSRAFALLCGALALWNLAYLGRPYGTFWRPVYLLGACAAAPLALSFALALSHTPRRLGRFALVPAAVLAGGLWVMQWWPHSFVSSHWQSVAVTVLGSILLAALGLIAGHALSLPSGPERRATLYVLAGGLVAAAGGLTDFVSRSRFGIVELGPLAVLLFLLVVFSVLVRYRFLDVDWFVARAVALIASAATVALVYFAVVHEVGARYVTLFVLTLLVLLATGPLGRFVLTRTRTMRRPGDPLGRTLLELSRALPGATSAAEVWRAIERGRAGLPGVRLEVYLRRRGQSRFHLIFRDGGQATGLDASPVPADGALPRLLVKDPAPLTRRYLEQEQRELRGPERILVEEALRDLDRTDTRLVVPLLSGAEVAGWIALGGSLPEHALTAEVAMELLAVGHQAAAALERIEAIETARRKESLAAVGELAAGLAHEVRNPVAAIRGAVQAMGPTATAEQRREMLEVIEEETGRLGRVVGEFLDYARPAPPRREPVDLGELARDVIRSARLAGRRMAFELSVEAGAPAALGDPDQLRRVLENLVRNAWEAAGEEGRLRMEIAPSGAERVALRVEDDGPGIPPEQVPRLFRPFQSGRRGGTGLGLALVYRIVESHGGDIQVEGRRGVGAAFVVTLPTAESDGERAAKPVSD